MQRQLLVLACLTLALALPGVAAADADIEIVSFTAPPLAVPDDPIGDQIHLWIRNAGNTDITTGFSVGFYVSPDAVITTGDQLLLGGREHVFSLAAGEEVEVPLYSGARIPPGYPLGPAYLGVIVDEFDVIPESDEWNNTAVSPVVVAASTEVNQGAVLSLALHGGFPNPFCLATRIRYDVSAGGARVTLRVFDAGGRVIRTLVDCDVASGERSVTWNGTDEHGNRVGPGVYFCRLDAGGRVYTRKMAVIR